MASFNTAAYCKARARLSAKSMEKVGADVAQQMVENETDDDLWCGRRVKVVDGSGLSMPDTPSNQEAWPQSARSKKGCGFPVMRVVVLFSLASGALAGLAKGALNVPERTLFRRIWNLLEKGDIVLADRGFCSLAEFFILGLRGVDCVMRKNQSRTVGVTLLKGLGKNDRLVHWHKTSVRPKWLGEEQWRNIPKKTVVREIEINVNVKGFRTKHITVATTLTDFVAFPTQAFEELYFRRWRAELYLRDIKTTNY